MPKLNRLFSVVLLGIACLEFAQAQPADPRKEMSRVDLSGAPGMEVVSSIAEYKKGDALPRHFHHGIEAAYVIQGAQVGPR